jgi:biopolymer transport protein ExbB
MKRRMGTIGALALAAALVLTGAAAAQEAPPVEVKITLLEILRDGGTIGHFILVVSIVALGLTIDNALILRRKRLCPPETVEAIEGLLEAGDVRQAAERCAMEPNLFTNIVAAGLAKVGHGFPVIEKALEEATEEESSSTRASAGSRSSARRRRCSGCSGRSRG